MTLTSVFLVEIVLCVVSNVIGSIILNFLVLKKCPWYNFRGVVTHIRVRTHLSASA